MPRSPPTASCSRERLALYTADVVALARKDLRLELRARDTLPAMLLFVLSTLAVFHFALPAGAGENAAYGLLWIAIVFTALLGLARAWAPEREGGALDGLVLAPCDRSAIWLGKTLATLAFLAAAELVALPAFALFFAPIDLVAVAGVVLASIGICAVGSLLAAMAAASRGREVILPLLFLPLAIPLVVGGVGAGISPDGAAYLRFSASTTSCSRYFRGPPSNMSSRNSLPLLAFSAAGLLGAAVVLALVVAPEDADQGISQRIFYFHVPIALTAYACFALGRLEGIAAALGRRRAARPRELHLDPPGDDLRCPDLDHGLDLGQGVVGGVVELGLEPARSVPRPLPLLLRLLHAPVLGRARVPGGSGSAPSTHCSASR